MEDLDAYCLSPFDEALRNRVIAFIDSREGREAVVAAEDGNNNIAKAFVFAAEFDHVLVLAAFLHCGISIDIKKQYGWTALMMASNCGRREAVEFLLDRNANVNALNCENHTALMCASMYASTPDYEQIVKLLLQKGADLNVQQVHGYTALMFAAQQGKKAIVPLLLSAGADPELVCFSGKTAAELARGNEIKEMLLNHVNTSYVLK